MINHRYPRRRIRDAHRVISAAASVCIPHSTCTKIGGQIVSLEPDAPYLQWIAHILEETRSPGLRVESIRRAGRAGLAEDRGCRTGSEQLTCTALAPPRASGASSAPLPDLKRALLTFSRRHSRARPETR